jgi:hypothetical protein
VIEPVGRINDLTLVVNPTTGNALIQNQSMQSLDMISYTISSAAGSLKSTFAGMQELPVANWFKANPTATNLSELNTGTPTPLAVGAEFSLGSVWNSAGNLRDLTFSYQTSDGVLHDGSVYFGDKAVIAPSNNADFNGNGVVDGADFLVWQRGFGLAGQPNKSTGDANGDGNVNADDYFRIDQGFLAQPQNPQYAQGDFNYDGTINADDYFLIDQAFLGQGAVLTGGGDSAPLSATSATAAVPSTVVVTEEPTKKSRRSLPTTTSLFSERRIARRQVRR